MVDNANLWVYGTGEERELIHDNAPEDSDVVHFCNPANLIYHVRGAVMEAMPHPTGIFIGNNGINLVQTAKALSEKDCPFGRVGVLLSSQKDSMNAGDIVRSYTRGHIHGMVLGTSDDAADSVKLHHGSVEQQIANAIEHCSSVTQALMERGNLQNLLHALKPADLEVALLKYYYMLNSQIAEEIGVSERTVEKRWHRAKITLQCKSDAHVYRLLCRAENAGIDVSPLNSA